LRANSPAGGLEKISAAGRSFARLDKILAERGYASSRSEAAELIKNGRVKVGGVARTKPSSSFDREAVIEVEASPEKKWVSRGAHKLLKALGEWNVNPSGLDCADIGASTGGFTQVLLEKGASRVAAVDVGYGQLAWELRNDPRVKVLERTNARYVAPADVGWLSSLITADVSFISLRTLLPNVMKLAREDGILITLVKPQFEVGRGRTRKGVVRDPALHEEVLGTTAEAAARMGLFPRGATFSPIKGPEGNIEFIFLLSKRRDENDRTINFDFASLVKEAHFYLG
jgi:23S rRNA (cytidine1920-2'-O)/16S rRNA (cytidine1409-2'-O)-methyltransferase